MVRNLTPSVSPRDATSLAGVNCRRTFCLRRSQMLRAERGRTFNYNCCLGAENALLVYLRLLARRKRRKAGPPANTRGESLRFIRSLCTWLALPHVICEPCAVVVLAVRGPLPQSPNSSKVRAGESVRFLRQKSGAPCADAVPCGSAGSQC